MKLVKLNLGCGLSYKKDWINVDFNREVKADIYCDLTKKLPFKTNSVDEVLMDNVLEHIKEDKYFKFIDELYRICKNGATIKFYVPHFTGLAAFKHPAHYMYFGIGSFGPMKIGTPQAGERYNKARFEVKERLMLLHHSSHNFAWANAPARILDNFFNLGGENMKLIWEKINLFGFEEIYYELKVVK